MLETHTLFLFWSLFAYLIGAIPFGYWIGKWHGLDIRTLGSQNIGATNVARVIGPVWGKTVFILDFLKGLLPTLLTHYFIVQYTALGIWETRPTSTFSANSRPLWLLFCFLLPIIGHLFPIFLRFKGGKGVATAAGVLMGLSPFTLITILVIFGAVFYKLRIISVASLTSAAMLPIIFIISTQLSATLKWIGLANRPLVTEHTTLFLLGWIGVSLWIIIRHRANIKRLLSGTEKSFKKP